MKPASMAILYEWTLLYYVPIYNKSSKRNNFGSLDEEVIGCSRILAGGFIGTSSSVG